MSTVSDRLHHAQQDFNAVIAVIPFDEQAVEESPTLKGQPVAFKDIVDVAFVPTTCGTNVDVGRIPIEDAPVVQRLTAKGALPVAKANLQEFSYGILGDASAYGRVINPRDPEVCGGVRAPVRRRWWLAERCSLRWALIAPARCACRPHARVCWGSSPPLG